jgi:hypothetical protein
MKKVRYASALVVIRSRSCLLTSSPQGILAAGRVNARGCAFLSARGGYVTSGAVCVAISNRQNNVLQRKKLDGFLLERLNSIERTAPGTQ